MTIEFEKKAHYQNLKARCLMAAATRVANLPDTEPATEEALVAEAKRYYNEVTGEDWSGPDVEGA